MAEEIVRIIKVDTKNSGKSIKDLRNEIKSLRTELEKTEVGTEEFESTLKKLTQTQKSYNEVQQQIRDLSRTNQQDMVRFASFARNLGKSYSALNAAIGLFADKNEDVQKAMLRVQRTIQLIQGLDGIAGLIRDIPKVINGFKSWLNALNPVERQVDRIAKGINGIDPAKARAINEANRAGQGGTTTTATAGGQVQQINQQTQAYQQQQRVITALNQARDEASAKVDALTKRQQLLQTFLNKEKLTAESLTQSVKEQNISLGDLNAKLAEQLSWKEKAILAQMKGEKSALMMLEFINQQINETKIQIATAEELIAKRDKAVASIDRTNQALQRNEAELAKVNGQLAKYNALLDGTASKGAKAWSFIKSIVSTVSWTLLISFLITAVYKLWDYITGLRTAAKEQKALNKEISEGMNQAASKQIVVLKELSLAYSKLGDSADKKKEFLQKYSDKIKETGLSIDDLKKAEDVFVNNTDKYINAIMARAKAQAIENAAIKIYEQYLNDAYDREQKGEKLTFWQKLASGQLVGQPDMYSQATQNFLEKNRAKAKKDLDQMEKDMDERLRKMFKDIAELEKEYSGIFATVTSTTGGSSTDWAAQYKEALEALKKYTDDYLDIMKDARTKELDDNLKAYEEDYKNLEDYYKKGIEAAQGNADKIEALRKERAEAVKNLQLKYKRQELEIIEKYNDEVFNREKAALDRQYSLLEKQLERNRRLYDTSNLKEPKQVSYQTTYNQNPLPFGIGRNWMSVYQTKEQVEKQYEDQVKYNNDFYAMTEERITKENELLQKEIDTLTEKAKMLQEKLNSTDVNDIEKQKEIVDQLIDIDDTLFTNRRTIAENLMALDNAVIENEQSNLDAYLDMQDKKKQALDGVLEVASTAAGALASIFRTEMQNAEEGTKQYKAAMIAYKSFAITQAIADTWKGANEAYAAMASIPYVGPGLGIAAAAAAVAMGLANVHSIINEKLTGNSQTASVNAPAPMETAPIEYTRNLVGDKELDEINQPIRCYVLESDISKTQNKVKVTEMNATF